MVYYVEHEGAVLYFFTEDETDKQALYPDVDSFFAMMLHIVINEGPSFTVDGQAYYKYKTMYRTYNENFFKKGTLSEFDYSSLLEEMEFIYLNESYQPICRRFRVCWFLDGKFLTFIRLGDVA